MSSFLYLIIAALFIIQNVKSEYSFQFFKSMDCSGRSFRGLGALDDAVCLNLSEDTQRRGYAGSCVSANEGFINFCKDNRCSQQCSKIPFISGECINLKSSNILPSSISPLIGSVLADCT
jgi:hypothetical protein